MRLFALALVASLFAAPVAALPFSSHAFDYAPDQAGPVEGAERDRGSTPVSGVELGTHLSDEGEELEAWLVRIAPILATHTQESGHEACGYIAQNQDGSRYGIRLTTSKGALTCVVDPTRVPEGMTALRATFHSHPQRSIVLPTAADELHYRANPLPSGQWIKRARPVDLGNSTFSAADYAAGAGYVVTKGRVFFQSGKGTDREVGALVH